MGTQPGPPHSNCTGPSLGPGRARTPAGAGARRPGRESQNRGPWVPVGSMEGGIATDIIFPTKYVKTQLQLDVAAHPALPLHSKAVLRLLSSYKTHRTRRLLCCLGAGVARGRGGRVPLGDHEGEIHPGPDLPQLQEQRLLPPGGGHCAGTGHTWASRPMC